MAYTLSNFHTDVHALYIGDTNTPTSSDSEWTVRTSLCNIAIRQWESEKGVLWNELWSLLSAAADGTKVVAASTLAYAVPTNFKFLGGYVRTYTTTTNQTQWQIMKPQQADLYPNSTGKFVFQTGNKNAGYKINFLTQPTTSDTIEYPYYKTTTALSSGSDAFEMPDPLFAVYFVLAKLHEQDGDGDRSSAAMNVAEEKLISMRTANAMSPQYQPNQMHDNLLVLGRGGFGT